MNPLKQAIVCSILSVFTGFMFCAEMVYAEETTKTSLTIYSTATPGSISPDLYRPTPNAMNSWGINYPIPGYAIIRDQREVALVAGHNKISFSNVAAYLDPTTVVFKSLTDPDTQVVEQDYHFDLVSNDKLLEKYLEQEITLEQSLGDKIEVITGKLLSTSGGLVVQDKEGKIISTNNYSNIRFPDLPGGLITKPTLVWDIVTNKAGSQKTETSYQTTGITWWTDYNAIYEEGDNANSGSLNLTAWVSIVNKSGASFDNAQLKLIAGDVNKVASKKNAPMPMMGLAKTEAATPGFEEKPFFEFHLYTLGRTTTIPNNSTKQIELFTKVAKIPAQKQYIYNSLPLIGYYGSLNTEKELGNQSNSKVDIYLKFKNSEKDGLGIPLPSGRIRVNKLDIADGSIEFIGEDIIDHTPKDENVLIKMGSAFDIVGERKQVNFSVDNNRHIMEETIEITLKNHKTQSVNVIIKETLPRGLNWQIPDNSTPYEKIDAQTIQFPIAIKADDEGKVRYTVRYTW